MSKASLQMIRGPVGADVIVNELDRLYCFEQVVAHWCKAVDNRLTGFATFVLPEELAEVAREAADVGERLAERIAQLGGEITADPTEFVARSPIDRFALPHDLADVTSVLALAIGYQRRAIAAYGELADRLRDGDIVTHRLLTEILAGQLAREDEIESVLVSAAGSEARRG